MLLIDPGLKREADVVRRKVPGIRIYSDGQSTDDRIEKLAEARMGESAHHEETGAQLTPQLEQGVAGRQDGDDTVGSRLDAEAAQLFGGLVGQVPCPLAVVSHCGDVDVARLAKAASDEALENVLCRSAAVVRQQNLRAKLWPDIRRRLRNRITGRFARRRMRSRVARSSSSVSNRKFTSRPMVDTTPCPEYGLADGRREADCAARRDRAGPEGELLLRMVAEDGAAGVHGGRM